MGGSQSHLLQSCHLSLPEPDRAREHRVQHHLSVQEPLQEKSSCPAPRLQPKDGRGRPGGARRGGRHDDGTVPQWVEIYNFEIIELNFKNKQISFWSPVEIYYWLHDVLSSYKKNNTLNKINSLVSEASRAICDEVFPPGNFLPISVFHKRLYTGYCSGNFANGFICCHWRNTTQIKLLIESFKISCDIGKKYLWLIESWEGTRPIEIPIFSVHSLHIEEGHESGGGEGNFFLIQLLVEI